MPIVAICQSGEPLYYSPYSSGSILGRPSSWMQWQQPVGFCYTMPSWKTIWKTNDDWNDFALDVNGYRRMVLQAWYKISPTESSWLKNHCKMLMAMSMTSRSFLPNYWPLHSMRTLLKHCKISKKMHWKPWEIWSWPNICPVLVNKMGIGRYVLPPL